jgi:hypothetical protein
MSGSKLPSIFTPEMPPVTSVREPLLISNAVFQKPNGLRTLGDSMMRLGI